MLAPPDASMDPTVGRRVEESCEQRLSARLSFLSYTEELKRQTAALDETRVELDSVQNQLALARSEIETIKAVATVSENTKQEAIDQVRSQWQEEVASLQAIMKGKD